MAPGHFALEVMSGPRAAADRPTPSLREADVDQALADSASLQIDIEATPGSTSAVRGCWPRLRCATPDAINVAATERHCTPLLTADSRIARSGAPITCQIIAVGDP